MPLARISIPHHLSGPRATALADAVHDALVATCGVPQDDLFQLVARFAPEAMRIDPHFPGGVARSSDASIVEISFLRGRSDAQKRALYRHLVSQAMEAGFRADDILVALTENGQIDWSLARGEAYASE